MKHFYLLLFILCFSIINAQQQVAHKHSLHKAFSPPQYFIMNGDKVKFDVYNTDSVRLDSGMFVVHTVEYVWDTINSGYIFLVKEVRLFCDTINPQILQNDIKSIISVIPKNGFKLLDKRGGNFR